MPTHAAMSSATSATPPAVVAVAEGVHLFLASTGSTGYKGVALQRGKKRDRYTARWEGRSVGTFDSAVGAAVCYARTRHAAEAQLPAGGPQATLGSASVVGPAGVASPSATSTASGDLVIEAEEAQLPVGGPRATLAKRAERL